MTIQSQPESGLLQSQPESGLLLVRIVHHSPQGVFQEVLFLL
jgi:hypothetical protein